MNPRKILWLMMTMLSVFGIAKAQSEPESLLQKSFQVGAGGTLIVEAAIGSVDVRSAGNGLTVTVIPQIKTQNAAERAKLLANLIVDATQQGNDVRVSAKFRRETPDDDRRQIRLRFEISVPSDYNVDLSTVGPVTTGDLRGNVKIETGGGDITLGNIAGHVTATSSGGKIKIAGLDSVQAETGGGSFTAYVSQQPHSDSSVSTDGGPIKLRLGESVRVDLDAAAINGRVITDTEPNAKRNALQTSINGGGPKLVLRAAAGRIYLSTHATSDKSEQQ